MAVIRSLQADTRAVRPNSTTADCAYAVVVADDGEVLFNLTTFGSDGRKNVGTPSQSMQFNEPTAQELCRLLRQAFPSIET